MKDRISYFMKCEFCCEKTEYIARDVNVNSSLTDGDIRRMIGLHSNVPQTVQYCDTCGMETLQTRVAWKGTLDTTLDA